jgi:hypothetical protein
MALLWVSETTFKVLTVGCIPMRKTRWTRTISYSLELPPEQESNFRQTSCHGRNSRLPRSDIGWARVNQVHQGILLVSHILQSKLTTVERGHDVGEKNHDSTIDVWSVPSDDRECPGLAEADKQSYRTWMK